MSNQFNEELKAFSEKHGAVLLGMHHDKSRNTCPKPEN